MTGRIKEYFEILRNVFGNIIATGRENKNCQLDEGVRAAIAMVIERASSGGKLLFIGNGASASIASHMAVDFWKNAGIRAISFNDSAALTALGNDCGYQHVFEKPVGAFGDAGDVLFAISSSGRSENILRAVVSAKEKALEVITLSGFGRDNPLRKSGDINFYVPASSYGCVEVAHTAICHCMLDIIIESKPGIKESAYHKEKQ